jgi:hypothetical protein
MLGRSVLAAASLTAVLSATTAAAQVPDTADGNLMSVRKGQPPPDLRNFERTQK